MGSSARCPLLRPLRSIASPLPASDAARRAPTRPTTPADNSTLGQVPKMGADEPRRAIEAAERALPEWRARTGKERAQVLRKLYELMMANQEDLAQLMTAEQGKPLT